MSITEKPKKDNRVGRIVENFDGFDIIVIVADSEHHPLWVEYRSKEDEIGGQFGIDEYDGPLCAPKDRLEFEEDVDCERGWILEWVLQKRLWKFDLKNPKEVVGAVQERCQRIREEFAENNLPNSKEIDFDGYTVEVAFEEGVPPRLNPPSKAHPGEPGWPPIVVRKPMWMEFTTANQIADLAMGLETAKGDWAHLLSHKEGEAHRKYHK